MALRDALSLGPTVWNGLLAQTPGASPSAGWAWHRAWVHAAPQLELEQSEALVLYGPGESVQVLLPFAVRRVVFRRAQVTALTWAIGDVACPDHLDLLAMPGADISSFVLALEGLPWEMIILSNLAEGAPNVARLCNSLLERGFAVARRPLWSCPYLQLPKTWDDYLASLSPTRRRTVRWEQRKLRRDHTVTLSEYGPDRWDQGWARLVELHQRRWNGAGVFMTPRVHDLHRSFSRELAERGNLWLTTLDLDGEPAAAWYGFSDRDTVYFCQCGRDPKWQRQRVGSVLLGLMIRRAIECGFRRFDFLRGSEQYKAQWTGTRSVTWELTVFRRDWRSTWLRALDWAGRVRSSLRGRIQTEPGQDTQEA